MNRLQIKMDRQQNQWTPNQFPGAAEAPPPLAQAQTLSTGRSALRWMGISVAVLVAAVLGLLTLLFIGFETGPVALILGFIFAVLPVPLYVLFVLWLDRYEAEPFWMLTTAFVWGAAVAVFIALIVNTIGEYVVLQALGAEAATLYGNSISAPVVEELAKASALFTLYFWKRDEFDGVLDGIIYAAMVGLGFAMTENMLYYGRSVAEGSTFGVIVVRGMFSPYAHPLFTSMTGIGLGLASISPRRLTRFVAPVCGLALAVILHSVWNTSLLLSQRFENGFIALGMYFLIMVPVFVGVLVAVVMALRREGRVLRQHLHPDLQRGLLPPEEYECLCTIRGRMSASFSALRGNGISAWRVRRRFNGVASELAFHRNRVARGVRARDGGDAAREAAYVQALHELYRQLSPR